MHTRDHIRKPAVLILAVALCGLNGCESSRTGGPALTEIPSTPLSAQPPARVVKPPVFPALAPAPSPPPLPTPVTLPPEALRPAGRPDAWVPLESWSQTSGFARLLRTASPPSAHYELRFPQGAISLAVGSQSAQWNGISFLLGFAPQLIRGQVNVHWLDLEKSFFPLITNCACALPQEKVIVLDPGHGGAQVGARSVFENRYEKDYTLDWALRVQKLLRQRGWRVELTRAADTDVPLEERAALAGRLDASLFISLHFNSGSTGQENGLETYCTTPAGLPSNLTRAQEDAAQPKPNNDYDSQNFCWAMRVQGTLVQAAGMTDRGVRRARFLAVLHDQARPAFLIEGGYLSNKQEAALIATAEYRQKLAEGVARAIGGE